MGLIRSSSQTSTTEEALGSQLRTGGLEINSFLRPMPQSRFLDTRAATQVSACGCCYWSRCSSPVPIALQERGYTRGGSAGARSERLNRSNPDLHSSERDSGIHDWGEHEDRGPGVQQPSETAAGRTSGGGQDVGDAHDVVQSGKSTSKPRCSGNTVVHIDRCY